MLTFLVISFILTCLLFSGYNIWCNETKERPNLFVNTCIFCAVILFTGLLASELDVKEVKTKTIPTIEYEIHQINDVSDTTYIYHFNLDNTD